MLLIGGGAWGGASGGGRSVHQGGEGILQHHRTGKENTGEKAAAGGWYRQGRYRQSMSKD